MEHRASTQVLPIIIVTPGYFCLLREAHNFTSKLHKSFSQRIISSGFSPHCAANGRGETQPLNVVPMPRHGQTFLGWTKCNKLFRFQVKLCATAPLCNKLFLFLLAVKSCALKFFPMRTSRAGGRVRCLSRAAKSKDLSSDYWARQIGRASCRERVYVLV